MTIRSSSRICNVPLGFLRVHNDYDSNDFKLTTDQVERKETKTKKKSLGTISSEKLNYLGINTLPYFEATGAIC